MPTLGVLFTIDSSGHSIAASALCYILHQSESDVFTATQDVKTSDGWISDRAKLPRNKALADILVDASRAAESVNHHRGSRSSTRRGLPHRWRGRLRPPCSQTELTMARLRMWILLLVANCLGCTESFPSHQNLPRHAGIRRVEKPSFSSRTKDTSLKVLSSQSLSMQHAVHLRKPWTQTSRVAYVSTGFHGTRGIATALCCLLFTGLGASMEKTLVTSNLVVLSSAMMSIAGALGSFSHFFASWYMAKLSTNPILTKAATAGVIGVIGDYMAQQLERFLDRKSHAVAPPTEHSYDARRGLSIAMDGLFISGPLMHFGYEIFEWLLPINRGGSASTLAAMSHVLADSVVLDSIFVATTFLVTGFVEGMKPRQLRSQFKSDYMSTLKASWVTSTLLMPIEIACFRFLPLSLRVLAVNFIDVIWDGVISFMAHRNRKSEDLPLVDTSTSSESAVTSLPPAIGSHEALVCATA